MSLPRYEDYKETGVPWLEDIPSHWQIRQARRLFEQRRDASLPGDEQLSATQKYGVIPQRLFMEQEDQKVVLALSGLDNFKRVRPDDFVISLRSFQGGIERSRHPGCVSPAYTVLRPQSGLVAGFWEHLFKSSKYIAALQTTTDGIRDGKNISYGQFGTLSVPLPPQAEQTAIAIFLDRETAKIDTLIAQQEKLITLLAEKRQATISHAVTRGLNPNAPMKDSGVAWLGEVPKYWAVLQIRHFANVLRGKFTHRPRNDPAYYDGDYPFVQTGDITGAGRYIESYKQTLNERGAAVSKEFPAGTLVMAIAANIGDVAILNFPAYFPDSIVGMVPKSDVELQFLYYLLIAMKAPMLQTATVSTQMNLNVDQISSLTAARPPVDEQNAIVRFLDAEIAQLEALRTSAERGISLLQERRSALIVAAVTGQIDVRNQGKP